MNKKEQLITQLLSIKELTQLTPEQRQNLKLACNALAIQSLLAYTTQLKIARDLLGRSEIPRTLEQIIDVVEKSAKAGVKPATINLRTQALKWFNSSVGNPIEDNGILRGVMRDIRRDIGGCAERKGGQTLTTEHRMKLFLHLIKTQEDLKKEIAEIDRRLTDPALGKSEKKILKQNRSSKTRSLLVTARNHIMFLLMAYSSQRPEAIRHLKFQHIKVENVGDKKAFSFYITHLKTDREGRGKQTGWIIDSDNDNLSLAEALENWKELLGNDDGFVIRGGNGIKSIMNPNNHAKPGSIQAAYKKYRDELELPSNSMLYTFRGSFITTALDNKVSKAQVMKMTLHQKEETMVNHYYEANIDNAISADDIL